MPKRLQTATVIPIKPFRLSPTRGPMVVGIMSDAPRELRDLLLAGQPLTV